MAAGTSFSIGLVPTGVSETASAASATSRLAEALEQAEKAAGDASAAVRAGEAAYAASEAAANRAAKAVEKIGLAADAQRGKMKAALDAGDASSYARAATAADKLAQAQSAAAAKAHTAQSALASEAAALDRLKASASQAADAEAKISKAHDTATKAAANATKAQAAMGGSGKLQDMAAGFGALGGPLGDAGRQFFGAAEGVKKLVSSMGDAGLYGAIAIAIVAIVAAVVAVTAAAIAGVAAITHWAIGLADAARMSKLLSAGIAGSVEGGAELDSKLDDLTNRLPQTRDELKSMAADLAKGGLKGKALTDALEEAAIKAAKLKLGPEWEKGAITIDKSMERLRVGIGKIFGGLKIEWLLGALQKLVALFDENSASANAIKTVFNSLFQPIVDGLAALVPKFISAFIQMEIWAMKAAIFLKANASKVVLVAEAFGILAAVIVGVVVYALAMIIAPFIAIGAIVVGVIAGFMWLGEQIVALGRSITTGGGALDWLVGKFNEAMAFLQGLSLEAIGKAMIDGLIAGITAGGAAVLSSITGVVGGAVDGAKKALGIASPSTVFAEIGMNTAAGMSQGVEGATSGVQGSLESMVAPPDGASGGTSMGAGGNTYTINISAPGGDAPSIAGAVEDVLVRLLGGNATQVGAEVPA